eukprot:Opistho-1_new@62219
MEFSFADDHDCSPPSPSAISASDLSAGRRRSSGLLTILEHPAEHLFAGVSFEHRGFRADCGARRASFELHRAQLSAPPASPSQDAVTHGAPSSLSHASLEVPPVERRRSVTMLENIGAADVALSVATATCSAINAVADADFDMPIEPPSVEPCVSSVVGSSGSIFFGDDFQMDGEGNVLSTGPLNVPRRTGPRPRVDSRHGHAAPDAEARPLSLPPVHYMRKRRNAICLSRTQFGGICKRRMLQAANIAAAADVDSLRVDLRNLAMR